MCKKVFKAEFFKYSNNDINSVYFAESNLERVFVFKEMFFDNAEGRTDD